MKKKTSLLMAAVIVLVIVVLVVAAYFMLARKQSGPKAVPLDELSADGEYQFGELAWGASLEDVKKALPYELTEGMKWEADGEYIEYNADTPFELGGRSATAAFEFHDGGLSTVKFSFHLGEDYEEWLAEQVQALTSLYGQETDKMENSSDGFASKGYRWDAEDTSLQIILMTGDKIKPSGTIVVGVK